MSTQPGVTIMPAASISRRPLPATVPMAVIRPLSMAMSAVKAGVSAPSMIRPLRITSSCMSLSRRRPASIRRPGDPRWAQS
jgi:hypothetical protein